MLTQAKAIALSWLASFWRPKKRMREVLRQYNALAEECPLALADLARFCCAFDSTHVQGDATQSQINVGKREAWLHIQAMLGLDPADLQRFKEETEKDG